MKWPLIQRLLDESAALGADAAGGPDNSAEADGELFDPVDDISIIEK